MIHNTRGIAVCGDHRNAERAVYLHLCHLRLHTRLPVRRAFPGHHFVGSGRLSRQFVSGGLPPAAE